MVWYPSTEWFLASVGDALPPEHRIAVVIPTELTMEGSIRARVVIWVGMLLLLTAAGFSLGIRSVIPGPASLQALLNNEGERRAIEAELPPTDSLTVVLQSERWRSSDPEFARARESLVAVLQSATSAETTERLFTSVNTMGHTEALDESPFVSTSKQEILINASSRIPLHQSAAAFRQLPMLLADWSATAPDFKVLYLSSGTADIEMFDLINADLDRSLVYTLPLTLAILLWTFGSIVAATIPIAIAILSLAGSLGATAIVSQVHAPVSATAAQLVVLLVLAIGIDYSLFMISRVREEVRRGCSYEKAVTTARSRTGITILWSGMTVGLSLFGLFLIDDTILTSMALVSVIAVLITVTSCIAVLPSVLLFLGEWIEFGRLPFVRSKSDSRLSKWVATGVRHPGRVVAVSLTALLAVSYFFAEMKLGTTVEPSTLPTSMQSAQAYAELAKSFPDLAGVDFTVILSADNLDTLEENGEVEPFRDALTDLENVRGPFAKKISPNGKVARHEYLALGSANSVESQFLVDEIRSELVPRYLNPIGIEAWVGGTLPYAVDEKNRYMARTPLACAVVLALSVGTLCIAFRSIVVPIKAVVLNVLSTITSFGVLVIIFQYGLAPNWHYGVIESFVPPLLFSILFGLSMDYHVFLLSRINELRLGGVDTRDAIERGVIETSGTITSAALIMVSVFLIISCLELPVMKQLGVGLAVAVLVDATIIRTLLLPASMVLLGEWNWYFPPLLRGLPEVKLD